MPARTAGRRLEAFVRANWNGGGGIRGFCQSAGVTPTAVYKWFAGKTSPELGHLTQMADALKVRRWEIIAAMDGDLDRQRDLIALEVEAAVRPLRDLMRDAGLLQPGEVPAATSRERRGRAGQSGAA